MSADRVALPELGQLYLEHRDVLLAYILKRCRGRREVAEDVLHDTFIKYSRWAETHSWEDRGRPQLALLKTIAGNLVRDWWRSGAVRFEVPMPLLQWLRDFDHLAPRDLVDVEAAALTGSLRGRWRGVLEQAVARLPRQQRQVLYLTYVEGMLQREIAIKLGTSIDAVKQATYRAMRALREDPTLAELRGELR